MNWFNKSKYPVIRQYDQIDCGAATLLSVLKYYGGNASLVHVRELCQVDVKGTTMLEVVRAAKALGFDSRGATGDYEDLMKEKLPCIAHVILESGLQHFLVVYKINLKGVLVGDPGKGVYKLTKNEFVEIWKKRAVVLLEPKNHLHDDTPPSWFQWIIGYLRKQESWIIQTLFLGIVYTILGLLTSLFVQMLIDRFIPDRDDIKIVYTGIFLLVLLIIRALAGFYRQRFLIVINKKVNIDINADFLSHIFRIPKKFFDTRKTGDITVRINDSMRIQQAILLLTNTTIIDGLVVMGSFALMFYFSPLLAWLSLIMVPAYGLILYSKSRSIKSEQNEVMKSHSRVESSYIDSLQGIDDILGFDVSTTFTRFNKLLFEHFQSCIEKLGLTQAALSLSGELSGAILVVTLLTVGAVSVIRDRLMLGQMMAAYALLANILPSIGRFIGAHIALQGASIAAQRLLDILLVDRERSTGTLPFIMKEKLVILDAAFSWPKSPELIKGLTLSIEKGKMVSLFGPTGSGKSTLVQIIQRKYPLMEGHIFIDETPAEHIDLALYRESIAVVPQDMKLFNGTVADNILVGREVGSINEIEHIVNQFGFDSFLSRFDKGLLTIVGEDSRKLSGGEMQMLGLIRALYSYPEILIVDEGFNSVDIEIENLIFNTLKEYAEDHAVFIITHDLKTISQTDYVYILEDGKIIEGAKPADLLSNQSSYLNRLLMSKKKRSYFGQSVSWSSENLK
ncbi:peptidase domain-containing ABC transporter [bacterium]|nr:peptidase domain-containing ABC transporter [bacterium]